MNYVKDKNLRIEKHIYDYLFKFYSRDLAELVQMIDRLDKFSLQRKSNITIPLVKKLLEN
jgi:DnaA family protein